MKKTALVITVGLLALTGAAIAAEDQSAVVNGNLKTPAGEYPLDAQQTGIPKMPGVPLGSTIDQLNAEFDNNSVPLEVQSFEDGLRVNLRCASDLPPEACISDEPIVPYPRTGIVDVDADGITMSQWITASSGQVFQAMPPEVAEQLPEEQREAIEEAQEQVAAEVNAEFVEGTGAPTDPSFRVRSPAADVRVDGKTSQLLSGITGGLPLGTEGLEDGLGEGWEDIFNDEAPGLQAPVKGGSNEGPAEHGLSAQSQGSDVATMAAMAAIVGGAILAPLALYHRIRSNNTLNNQTRQSIYDAVVRTPGMGVNDAAKAAGCSYSTAAYHLERLVEERLLVASEDGRRARFFKNGGAFTQAERDFVPILQSDECLNVLQVIVENPWCYRAEVAQKLGVSGPTVNWHLKKLMGVGAVKEMREGRISYLYADKKLLTQMGANLLGKMPDEVVGKLRFEGRPQAEMVEPALHLPETTVPEVGVDEVELAPLPESR